MTKVESGETPDDVLLCDWCGQPFRPPKAIGRRPRYCRQSCRQRAYEERATRRRVELAVARATGAAPAPPSADPPAGGEEPTLPGLEDPG